MQFDYTRFDFGFGFRLRYAVLCVSCTLIGHSAIYQVCTISKCHRQELLILANSCYESRFLVDVSPFLAGVEANLFQFIAAHDITV